jgi:hypothetical protein
MVLASEEALLWEVCLPSVVVPADTGGDIQHRLGLPLNDAQHAVGELLQRDLVALFWAARDQKPDLGETEIVDIFGDDNLWPRPSDREIPSLRLTPTGESVFYR